VKEYTLIAVISVLVTILLDRKSGARVLQKKIFYVFFAVITGFKIMVNGYLTRYIVMYDLQFFLGIRIGTIPVEDFLFGFSMVTMSIIFWEYFKQKRHATGSHT
jgi:lycopene cyclase domain-containing protein